MKTHWWIGALCVCTSLGLAAVSSQARADILLDSFTVDGDGVDPDGDIPALREITDPSSLLTINTGSGGSAAFAGTGDADLFYSFGTLNIASEQIAGFGIDLTAYSGEAAELTFRLVDSDSNIHDVGPNVFSGPGIWVAPLSLFDGGAFTDIDFAQVLYSGAVIGGPSLTLGSVFFTQVPEPSSITLLALGLGGAFLARRRARGKGGPRRRCERQVCGGKIG